MQWRRWVIIRRGGVLTKELAFDDANFDERNLFRICLEGCDRLSTNSSRYYYSVRYVLSLYSAMFVFQKVLISSTPFCSRLLKPELVTLTQDCCLSTRNMPDSFVKHSYDYKSVQRHKLKSWNKSIVSTEFPNFGTNLNYYCAVWAETNPRFMNILSVRVLMDSSKFFFKPTTSAFHFAVNTWNAFKTEHW